MTAPALAHPAAELERLRAELAELRAIIAAPDPTTDPAYWRALFADAHRADVEAAYWRGRADEERSMAAAWRAAAGPVAHGGPPRPEVERFRWHVCCLPCRRGGHQAGCERCEDRTRETFGQAHPDDSKSVTA